MTDPGEQRRRRRGRRLYTGALPSLVQVGDDEVIEGASLIADGASEAVPPEPAALAGATPAPGLLEETLSEVVEELSEVDEPSESEASIGAEAPRVGGFPGLERSAHAPPTPPALLATAVSVEPPPSEPSLSAGHALTTYEELPYASDMDQEEVPTDPGPGPHGTDWSVEVRPGLDPVTMEESELPSERAISIEEMDVRLPSQSSGRFSLPEPLAPAVDQAVHREHERDALNRSAAGGSISDAMELDPEELEPMEDPLLGRVVAQRFRIDTLLATGSMGRVYRAHQLALRRSVALKILMPEDQDLRPEQLAQAFHREAIYLAGLRSPHTIGVLDRGQHEGLHWLAMELLDGASLREVLLERGTLDVATTLTVGMQLCIAVAELHHRGLVHRDIKPANVLMTRDAWGDQTFVLVDFGLVAPAGSTGTRERPRLIVGSPRYMSPEQAAGQPVDQRSDLYSLGTVLYTLLCGHAPFQGGVEEVLAAQQRRKPPPLAAPVPLPAGLEEAVMGCLAKRPERRPQSARELHASLSRIAQRRGPRGPGA